jgi:hypothetical protein
MLVTILAAVLVAMTPAGTGANPDPTPYGGGGPDPYGYRYLDSDTTCPGAPTYSWIEIKGVGTQITGLGDDNVVGPFPLGFSFPYYWYQVTSVYVGSNGYIAFHDNAMNASPFQRIPSTNRSNNTLACLMSDIIFDAANNATAWYWTNAALDTFIVEYDSVPFWSTGGNNTFEIILSRPDSSITFQYKEQSGAPYNGWAPTSNQTGIENVSGAIGLNYLSGVTPTQNMYHTDLAVRFYPPDSTTYQVHDAGVDYALNEWRGGVFQPNTRPMPLWAKVKNYGNQPENAFKVYCKVTRANGTVVFTDSTMTPAMAAGQVESLNFLSWTPTSNGTYIAKFITNLTGDAMRTNDTAQIETRVITLPATLTYTDSAYSSMYWNGFGGFGNRFIPPVYPCTVTAIRAWASSASGRTCTFGLYDDNGVGGGPGDTLYQTSIMITAGQWYQQALPTAVEIADGTFFIGIISPDSSVSFGMDSVPPLSNQGWEFTGVWAPGRDASARDVCISAVVRGQLGIEELNPMPIPMPVRIDASPNPLRTTAVLRLVNPRGGEKAIEVYDATGSIARTVALERGRAVLDAGRLADGIYFARVVGSESPVTKLIVSH